MLWLQKVHLPLSEVGQPYPGILQSGLLDLKINVQACVSAAKRKLLSCFLQVAAPSLQQPDLIVQALQSSMQTSIV